MKYYGTLGPSCEKPETLKKMFAAGMTGIRLNLSHGGLADCTPWLEALRTAAEGLPCELLIDLQGPELRIGRMNQPLNLPLGDSVLLGEGGIPCPKALLNQLHPGHKVLLDDGKLQLTVENCREDSAACMVIRGGLLESRKSIAVPGVSVDLPTLTAADRENLALAKETGVTGVMLPFVRGAQDIRSLRSALDELDCGHIRIFAKIENLAGVEALPGFLSLVDEVVIARGDLGNAVPLWELPRLQKQLSAQCREAGVPFMVVTQLLDSMHRRAVPTRAEVSDIYNAVLDGCASLMLTGETAAGEYPVESMEYLVRTAQTGL